jgi:hypothetical protein
LIPAVFALLVPPSAALAQLDATAEVFGGYFSGGFSTESGFSHTTTIGVRSSYNFSRVWAVEAAISRSSDFLVAYNGDLSAKAYVFQRTGFGLFALAGIGVQRNYLDGLYGDEKTIHAGIGADVALSDRTYLRPEIRYRWPTDHVNEEFRTTDFTLGFGWRF